MKLQTIAATETGVELHLNEGGDQLISISCEDAMEDAPRIVRAVNTFDALVGVLTLFRSSEMGNLLIGLVDMREENGEAIQKRLTHLISMVDFVLDAAEAENDDAA
jgi:hypothetical protein